jgi:hypothetical protein
MTAKNLWQRSVRFLVIYASLRAIEWAFAIAALLVTSWLHQSRANAMNWSIAHELSAALLISRVYYVGFHYLLLSGAAFVLAEAVWGLDKLRVIRVANLTPYVVHSGALAVFIFGRNFDPFLGAWISLLIVNWMMPALVTQVWTRMTATK